MHHSNRQFALILGSAMLVALLALSTEAEAARKKSTARSAVGSSQIVQPSSPGRSSYGYQVPPGGYDRYNMPPGGGINFNDGRLGANYSGGG
jgi:hypothetical protein